MRKHLLALAPLALLAAGFTDCEYFSTVTVPRTDTTAPSVFNGVWRNGEYVQSSLGTPFTYTIAPGETVLAIGAGLDGGGTRELKMYTTFGYTCCAGDICSRTQPLSAPKVETQPGGVGSQVSSGIWLYSSVKLPTCSGNMRLESYGFSWWTEATDFHGNKTVGRASSIVYP